MYKLFLEDWIKEFDEDRMLIIRSEDLENVADFGWEKVAQKVFQFLDVPYDPKLKPAYTVAAPNTPVPMSPSTRYILERFFEPLNSELVRAIKDSGIKVCGVNEKKLMEEADRHAKGFNVVETWEGEEFVEWEYDVAIGI